jgi:hypothetical protein
VGIWDKTINPLNAELNIICHFLALLGTHHIFYVSGFRVKNITSLSAHGNTNIDKNRTYIQALTSIRNHNHTVRQVEPVLALQHRYLISLAHDGIHIYFALESS